MKKTMIKAFYTATAILLPTLANAVSDPFSKVQAKGDVGLAWLTSWLIPSVCLVGLVGVGIAYIFNKGQLVILKNVAVGLAIILSGDIIITWMSA